MNNLIRTETLRMMLLLLLATLAWGCAGEVSTEESTASASHLDPDDPTILRRPFTAEQIHDEWVEGFALTMKAVTPAGESAEHWTVVAADDLGVEIERIAVDRYGEPLGEPSTEHSGWIELRDHATFPAATSRVEAVTRETELGALEGWLYTVDDPQAGTVTEYFFAADLPGAPVQMSVSRDGEVEMEMRQVERHQPSE